jgi:hypothetical protein
MIFGITGPILGFVCSSIWEPSQLNRQKKNRQDGK